MAKHADTPNTAPGTAYGDTRERLAQFFYELVYGPGTWPEAGPDYRQNYMADAADALALLPHLLDLGERERLAPTIPALAP